MYMLPVGAWGHCLERWDRIAAYFERDTQTLSWCNNIPSEAADWEPSNAAESARL